MSIPAWCPSLLPWDRWDPGQVAPKITFPATSGVRVISSQSTAHQKGFFKPKPDVPGTEWMPGLAGRQNAPSLRTGPQPPLPCPPPARGRAVTSYSREKFISILFFNVFSKTKAFQSSRSCPWRSWHEGKELKSALKRV